MKYVIKKIKDKFGRYWNLSDNEHCKVCGQPDSLGECNHKKLTKEQVTILKEVM